MFHAWELTFSLFDIIPEGERFQWSITDKVGKGSFGLVFKAVDDKTGDFVAVKELRWNSNTEKRINKEIGILSLMHHQNIARMVEAFRRFKNSSKVYIAMEFCPGGELFTVIVNRGHLTEKMTKQVSRELLSALVYCHAKSVAHLDLKPENIVLSTQWDGPPEPLPAVKLVDWGLSSRFEDFDSCPSTCPVKGSPRYIAPEVFNNKYSEKADLWSLGVITYILLEGNYPFDNPLPKTKGAAYNIPTEADVQNVHLDSEYSKDAGVFIKCLLACNPNKRLSASQALQQPWFDRPSSVVVNPDVINNLRKLNVTLV